MKIHRSSYLDGEQLGDALLGEPIDDLGRDPQLGNLQTLVRRATGAGGPLVLLVERPLLGRRELRPRRRARGPRLPEPQPRRVRVEPRRRQRGGRRQPRGHRPHRRRLLLEQRGRERGHGAPPEWRRAAEGGVHGCCACFCCRGGGGGG